MKIKRDVTYIEKPEHYYSNRVFVAKNIGDEFVTGVFLNFETNRHNSTRISRRTLEKRFEVSPIQMR